MSTETAVCYLNKDEIQTLVDMELDMAKDEIKDVVAQWKANCDRWVRDWTSKAEVAKELIDADVEGTEEWNIVEAVIRKMVANDPHAATLTHYWDDLVEMVEVFG